MEGTTITKGLTVSVGGDQNHCVPQEGKAGGGGGGGQGLPLPEQKVLLLFHTGFIY